jgi:hypothetical protein
MNRSIINAALAAVATLTVGWSSVTRAGEQTTSFQYGVNGYTSTTDQKIYSNDLHNINSTGTYWGVDGYLASNGSPDAPGLFRFDDLFGAGPGQIPVGAYILDAQLQLTSHNLTNSRSGGVWGLAPLIKPFDSTTTDYASFDISGGVDAGGTGGNRGPWFENNQAGRPIASYNKPADSITTLSQYSAHITSTVQGWANNPSTNYGLVLQAGFPGTSDAWDVRTHNYKADSVSQPKLSITYTTDPVNVSTFQKGVNNYTASTSAYMLSDPVFGDATDDGDYHDQDYIDGDPPSAMVIKYNNIFGDSAIPSNAKIRKAWLVITSGDSDDDRSGSKFDVDQLSQSWDTTTLWHDFGTDGPTGNTVAVQDGIMKDQQVWFDVTQSLIDWQGGTANNGWSIRDEGGDGWQARWNGSFDTNLRPELMVAWSPFAGEFAWNLPGGGNWNDTGSWTGGGVPNLAGAAVTFGSVATSDATVNVASNVTVGSLNFDNTHSYTLSGTGVITLSGETDPPSISVITGSHTIAAPLALTADTTITVTPPASVLTVSNLAPSSVAITKAGAGTLAVNNVRAGGLNITTGIVQVTPNGSGTGVSKVGNLTIATGAKLDLTDNKLIVSTPNSAGTWDGTKYTGVSGLVQSARGTGNWNGTSGITSSSAATNPNPKLFSIGVVKVADLHTGMADGDTTTFAGQTVQGSDTIAMYTYGGDANLDGKINIDDYGLIDSHVGQSGTAFGWHNGDFNYDGKINIDDYGIIDGNIGAQGAPIDTSGAPLAGVAVVPEPGSLALLGLLAPVVMRRRRRQDP